MGRMEFYTHVDGSKPQGWNDMDGNIGGSLLTYRGEPTHLSGGAYSPIEFPHESLGFLFRSTCSDVQCPGFGFSHVSSLHGDGDLGT